MGDLKKVWRINHTPLHVNIQSNDSKAWNTNYGSSVEVSDHLNVYYLIKETEKTYLLASMPDGKWPHRYVKDKYHWFFSEADALAFLTLESARITERLRGWAAKMDQLNTALIKALEASKHG